MKDTFEIQKIAQNWTIDKLREGGIEVIENYEDFEQVFDDLIFSGELIMDKKNRTGARAAKVANTSSVRLSNPHLYTTLNNINSQVILINLQNLVQKISDNKDLLSTEEYLIELKKIVGGTDKHDSVYLRNLINTDNYTLRFSGHNINSANARPDEKTTSLTIKINKSRFNDSEKNEVIEFVYFNDKLTKERMIGILSGIENWMKIGEYNYLDCDKINASIGYKKNNSVPSIKPLLINEGDVYGFAHENKIYLNPYVLSSQTPIHEYTHLWDNYIKNTNVELWNKGKKAFKDTIIWNEVINDPNYIDIKDNDDLVLSECHARICGRVAEKVLERIARENGEIKKDEIIDWNKETWKYIAENFGQDIGKFLSVEELITSPFKDLFVIYEHFINSHLNTPYDVNQIIKDGYYYKENDNKCFDKDIADFGKNINSNETIKLFNNQSTNYKEYYEMQKKYYFGIDTKLTRESSLRNCSLSILGTTEQIYLGKKYYQIYKDLLAYIETDDKNKFIDEYKNKPTFKLGDGKDRYDYFMSELADFNEPSLFPDKNNLLKMKEHYTECISLSESRLLKYCASLNATKDVLKDFKTKNFQYETDKEFIDTKSKIIKNELTFKTQTKKEIINDFLLDIKKNISNSTTYSGIVSSASEALNHVSEQNKPIINKFLTDFYKTNTPQDYFEKLKTTVLNTQKLESRKSVKKDKVSRER